MIHFQLSNYRRVKSAKIGVSRIAFVAGMNGNGKTSLCQGIGGVLSGERLPPGLVAKLTEAGVLVHSGAAEGKVRVEVGEKGADNHGFSELAYPKAEFKTKGEAPRASIYAVGLASVVDLPEKERGLVLAKYLKTEPTAHDLLRAIQQAEIVSDGPAKDATDEEKKAMAELGLDPERSYDRKLYRYFAGAWRIITTQSWDRAHAEAVDYGKKQKVAWELTTGEKAYQPTGADTWRPNHADWDEELLTSSVETLEGEVAKARSKLDEEVGKGAVDQHKVQQLQARVSAYQPTDTAQLEDTLNKAQADLANERAKLERLPQPEKVPTILTCPHCGADSQLATEQGPKGQTFKLLAEVVPVSEEENARRLDAITFTKAQVESQSTIVNQTRAALTRAQAEKQDHDRAKAELDELLSKTDNSKAIDAARTALAEAENRLRLKKQKADADKAHRNVQTNQRMIDLLAPAGLRKAKLSDVVEAFNAGIIGPLCELAGWGPVTMDDDMRFRYDGCPFALAAESFQLRTRILLQLAMARLDGSSMVVIDRADMLDDPGIQGLLNLLLKAGIPALVCATFSTPDKLPQLHRVKGGAVYWLEEGAARMVVGHENGKAVFA